MQTELEERARQFVIRLMKVSGSLAQTPSAISAQELLEAGRAVAANYRAAIRAETHADFIEQIELAAKEAAEAKRLLEICQAAQSGSGGEMVELIDEAGQVESVLISIGSKAKNKS